jgi:hypothetical protein
MSEAKSAGDCGMTASDFAPLRGASSGLRAVEVNRLETSMSATSDPRLYLPHVARNRDPILAVLRRVLPPAGLVLEVASGSGEHAIYFAQSLPALLWQPSDCDAQARASIAAHRAAAAVPNLLAPLELDVTLPWWPVERADALVCINMIHIAPWAAAQGLFAGPGASCRPAASSISMALTGSTGVIRRRATSSSTLGFVRKTARGACAISARSRIWLLTTASF